MGMQRVSIEVPAQLVADLDRLASVVRLRRDVLVRLALRFALDHFGQMIEDSAINPAGFEDDT